MARKSVSDEQIIAALLQTGSTAKAAEALGISPRTIYDRQQDQGFQDLYKMAKNDIYREAVYSINQRLGEAVDAVAEIMNDREINPATRLQAAQTILNNAAKFSQRLAADERPKSWLDNLM